jgi:PAS domain S-box-containing protein
VTAALAIIAWRRRPAEGTTAFAVLMAAVAEWSFAYALELASPDLPTQLWWDNVGWLGAVIAPAAWLAFALRYTGHGEWLRGGKAALLALEPLAILLLVWTNGAHGLIWSSIHLDTSGPFAMLAVTRGIGFWIDVAYSYLLIALGTILIGMHMTRRMPVRPYRAQDGALLLAVSAPWLGNILYLSGISPVPRLDPTPLAFTVSGLAWGWDLFRFHLFDLVPVARDLVVDSISDAVLVLDEQNRIVDLNLAAQRAIGHRAQDAIGQPADQVLDHWPDLVDRYRDTIEAHAEIAVRRGSGQARLDLRISPILDRLGRVTGRLVIWTDITEHWRSEQALRESEARVHSVFDEAPIGMALVGLDDRLLQVNHAFARMVGCTKQELLGRPLETLTHPVDMGKDDLLAEQVLNGESDSYKLEKRCLTKTGEVLWAEFTTTVIRDQAGQALYRLVMIEDILDRKRATLLEQEQRHVVFELHDELAQLATAAHQHLQAVAARYRPRSPRARWDLEQAVTLTQLAAKEVRRLIAGMQPTALDSMGLAAALRLHVENLRADGWVITYAVALSAARLPPAIETALFRIAMEALTNVRKHARTTHAHLALQRRGSAVCLEVRDWGCGFDPSTAPTVTAAGEHIGLRGMQERVELIGGHFEVRSRPGAGTIVAVAVPVLTVVKRGEADEREARSSKDAAGASGAR